MFGRKKAQLAELERMATAAITSEDRGVVQRAHERAREVWRDEGYADEAYAWMNRLENRLGDLTKRELMRQIETDRERFSSTLRSCSYCTGRSFKLSRQVFVNASIVEGLRGDETRSFSLPILFVVCTSCAAVSTFAAQPRTLDAEMFPSPPIETKDVSGGPFR